MFTVVVTLEVRPEELDAFVEGIGVNARASLRDEPGCLRFDVGAVADDETRFVLYELYTDAAAFEAHRRAPHFARWREAAARVLVPGSQVNTPGELVVTHSAEVRA